MTTPTPPPSPSSASNAWTCPRCGAGWPHEGLREYFVPFGQTARVKGCPACLWRDLTQPEVQANTIAAYGLDVGHLAGMTLAAYRPLTAKEREAKRVTERVAALWAEGQARSLWLWSAIVDPPEMREFTVPGQGKRLLPVSGCGAGKTHLAVALAKQALTLGHTLKFATEGELVDGIRASYDDKSQESEAQILRDYGQAWLLVLDDVGTADVKAMSLNWYQAKVYAVIDKRYRESRPVVLTTNLPPDEFAARLGPRVMSRLEDMGGGVHLDGPDRRRMKG